MYLEESIVHVAKLDTVNIKKTAEIPKKWKSLTVGMCSKALLLEDAVKHYILQNATKNDSVFPKCTLPNSYSPKFQIILDSYFSICITEIPINILQTRPEFNIA